ncbi:PatB family C-S lyase [Thiomicrospira sp. S5]|uniref:PatB family C-S lyase n=1 Tax=Thiomicrospira sp. S5 TaxID=1803865 RepID=UPI000F8A153F|nr:PatB family C-S lyase [Thiomicrospira sp. S5]AZR81803.1 aminotransferase class I/II [Thiomicrospira sp. S5]
MFPDFEHAISRLGTDAEKYELRQRLFGSESVLPMWVADQDLPTPDFILEALKRRLEHPILGYNVMPDSLYQSIIDWQAQYGYDVKASEILFTHNVANGFFMAVSAFSEPGDAVLVQPPIYPPFLHAPENNGRRLVEAPLVLQDNRYQIDFDAFEAAITENEVKLFLFCNPQNPSGRVWRREELQRLADICLKHGVTVVSDEIHADMTFSPLQHIPMASLSEAVAQNTVTLSSPGKTFNLGGLQSGYAIIANRALKAAYLKVCRANSIHDLNLFGKEAMQAAYSEAGKAYRDTLLVHLQHNIDRLEQTLADCLPAVRVMRPEASFLVWLDFSELFGTKFQSQENLKRWLTETAQLGLNDGESFGEVGKGFMRINIAVPTETMDEALKRFKNAAKVLIP